MDAVIAPIWMVANIYIIWVGWCTAKSLAPNDTLFWRTCQIVLFWWGCIALSAFTLGAAHSLSGLSLLAVAILYATVVLATTRAVLPRCAAATVQPSLGEANTRHFADRLPFIIWSIWLAWMLGRIVITALLGFPEEFDTLMYHIPLIDQWLRARSLYAPDDAVWYNPANSELIGLWLVAPFSGDFLVGLVNVPPLLLLVAVSVELGTELGLTRLLSHFAALSIMSNQVMFRQTIDAKNDLAVLALFIATYAIGLRYLRERRWQLLPYVAAAFGLLCGVKYYAAGYAATAWLVFLAATCVRGLRVPATRLVFAALLGAIFHSGYWYIRNFLVTGTPVYPKGIGRGADIILDVRPELWETTLLGHRSVAVLRLLVEAVQMMAGQCQFAAFVGMPIIVAWLLIPTATHQRSSHALDDHLIRTSLALLIIGTGLVWGFTPFAVETIPGTMNMLLDRYLPVRFGICVITLCVYGLALLTQDLSRCLGSLIKTKGFIKTCTASALPTLFGAAVTYQCVTVSLLRIRGNNWESILVAGNVLCLGILCYMSRDISRVAKLVFIVAGTPILAAVLSWSVTLLSAHWHKDFASHYDTVFGDGDTFQSLERRDPAANHVCVLSDRYYPFFGSYRQFSVSRASFLSTREQALSYISHTRATLVAALRRPSITVGEARLNRRGDWLDDYPNVFQQVASSRPGKFRLWYVNQPALSQLLKQRDDQQKSFGLE